MYRRALNTCPSVVDPGASFCMIRQSSYFPEVSGCKNGWSAVLAAWPVGDPRTVGVGVD
jgi:hypothetical protein